MKTMLKIFVFAVLASVALDTASAQFSRPEDAVKYRKSVMFLISQHFGRMGAMVKEQVPYDKEVFAQNARVLEMLAHLPWEAFLVPGTDKGDTTLKSSVFEQQAQFKETAAAFEASVAGLLDAARSGDFDAIKAQFGKTGQNCKACHDRFRAK